MSAKVLDDRKAAILKAVVEEYIETAQPVGSAVVARTPGMASPATVRNEMGVLEREGYLVQPHTSAGRIPTDKGYRFFVDHLSPGGRLDALQSQQVRTFFARAHGELERTLADTSRFLAVLTDYAAVVVDDDEQQPQVFVGGASHMAAAFDAVTTIRQVLGTLEEQYVLMTLLKDVLDRGLSVAIGAEHGVQPLADCSIVVAPYEVEGERAGTVGILGPTRMHYEQTLAAVAVVSRRLGQALSKGTEER